MLRLSNRKRIIVFSFKPLSRFFPKDKPSISTHSAANNCSRLLNTILTMDRKKITVTGVTERCHKTDLQGTTTNGNYLIEEIDLDSLSPNQITIYKKLEFPVYYC